MSIIAMTIGAVGVKRTISFLLFFIATALFSYNLGHYSGERGASERVNNSWEARMAEAREEMSREIEEEIRRQYEQAQESEEIIQERVVVYKDRVVEKFRNIVVNSEPSPTFCDMGDDRLQTIRSIAAESGATLQ